MVDENDTGTVIRLFLQQASENPEEQACEALQIIHTLAGCASNKLISVIGL